MDGRVMGGQVGLPQVPRQMNHEDRLKQLELQALEQNEVNQQYRARLAVLERTIGGEPLMEQQQVSKGALNGAPMRTERG